MQYLKSIVKSHKYDPSYCVVSVPGYYTEFERVALLNACKIVDLNVLKVMNEPSASFY